MKTKRITDSIKHLANQLDKILGTSIKSHGGRVYRYLLRKLSPIRMVIDPLIVSFVYTTRKKPGDLKLHLGCGWKHFDKYTNVDIRITDATDIICDITRLPWPKDSASTIENYHVIEHISHTKINDAIADWYRVLKPGGKLIIECPNFDLTVQEYLSGREERLINIFGQQRFPGDAHLFGYNFLRLKRLLEDNGFKEIVESIAQSSQSAEEPSFRIECKKPLNKLNY